MCNICSAPCRTPVKELHREAHDCPTCTSSLRWRSVIAALSVSLFGTSYALDDMPSRLDLVGLGTSDWEGYAMRLTRVFDYRNTYYDQEPRLDIGAELPPSLVGSCDFVISSDVLEHVAPPYENAFCNLRALLKPGGLLVLTVPMKPEGSTDEHYPELFEFETVKLGSEHVVVNRTRSGEIQTYRNPVFHGGPGSTLEMRLFSLPDVVRSLHEAGFLEVKPFDEPIVEHGIVWNESAWWPIVAR